MIENQLKTIIQRIANTKTSIETEEATKNAFILPMIQMLGYDIFNPLEVVPEYVADVGVKKGEKVDYCLKIDGTPVIIIECKKWQDKLTKYSSQLYRYFSVTKARFGIYTNGIVYKFYSDLESTNQMDQKPFLEVDLENIKEDDIKELAKFQKQLFDVKAILDNASELKYLKGITGILDKELKEPSDDYVRFFASQVYSGRLSSKMIEYFRGIVKESVRKILNERMQTRLRIAEQKESEQIQERLDEESEEQSRIVTTAEEIESFHIIKAILRSSVDVNRIHHRDTKSYFGILLDDNNRKPICRLFVEGNNWYLGTFDEQKNFEKHKIESLDDIYKFAETLIRTATSYDEKPKVEMKEEES